ncbi:MAG: glutamate racemase, partial [Thermoproteota archaeon]|nr:glutamate racemase [Thermoproteota archaeon]
MKIAVFDSGFGSISIIREIQKIFKGELIYFADQKNFPYGIKSKKELEDIIKDTVNLLEEKFSPDFIIMASNTPTLLLDYSRISRKLAGIYPPLSDAVKISRTRNIAILGTRSVIQSESVTEFIEKCNVPNDIVIHKIDCSLLVELVESGKFLTDEEYCKNIIKEVLEDIFLDNLIDV